MFGQKVALRGLYHAEQVGLFQQLGRCRNWNKRNGRGARYGKRNATVAEVAMDLNEKLVHGLE